MLTPFDIKSFFESSSTIKKKIFPKSHFFGAEIELQVYELANASALTRMSFLAYFWSQKMRLDRINKVTVFFREIYKKVNFFLQKIVKLGHFLQYFRS